VVKETARRFKDNTNFCNCIRIGFSGIKAYVSLEGDQSIWQNKWNAAGKEITWDMIHYDVQ
jgi:preprotein translocase subunit SecA